MDKDLISILIPIYNESDNLDYLIGELNKNLEQAKEFDVELILIDDGSSDNSFEKLNNMPYGNYQVKIIKLSKNFGAHPALRAGLLNSTGKYVTNLTADLQDSPTLPARLYNKISEGYDIVWAHRRTTKTKGFERIFSIGFARLMNIYVSKDYPKNGIDIFMISDKIRDEVNKNIEANSSLQFQILGMGFKQTFIEYDKVERKSGKSKWTMSKKVKAFIDSFIASSYAPIRYVTVVGISFFVIGVLWTVYIIGRQLLIGDLPSGWPALTSILFIGFGTTNISLGVIAEYLWRTFDASRKRPAFFIDEIVNKTNSIN